MAKLFFRYGAMNSGKSTALLQVAHNYEERGMNVLLVKASIDSKGDNKVVSRIGMDRVVDTDLFRSLWLAGATAGRPARSRGAASSGCSLPMSAANRS